MMRNVIGFRILQDKAEQRCSESSVVCLGGTEDSRKGESRNNHDVEEKEK